MLRRLKNSEKGGKPAASKTALRRWYMVGISDEDDGEKACERRTEAEKGKARRAAVEVK